MVTAGLCHDIDHRGTNNLYQMKYELHTLITDINNAMMLQLLLMMTFIYNLLLLICVTLI